MGARVADVMRMVALKAVVAGRAGIAAGLFGAWAASRLLAGLLFGVTAGMQPLISFRRSCFLPWLSSPLRYRLSVPPASMGPAS